MNTFEKYTCAQCGETHNEWPALTYKAPLFYDQLSDDDKENIAFLNSDFCEIDGVDTTDLFIRCTLAQPVNDHVTIAYLEHSIHKKRRKFLLLRGSWESNIFLSK